MSYFSLFLLISCIKIASTFTISQIYGEAVLGHWNVYVSGPYGSTSEKDGEFFTDFRQSLNGRSVQPNHWPNGINVRSGGSIDALQFFYGNYHGRMHGWENGGALHKIRLYDGDKIIKVTGRRGIGPGALVDQLTFYTSEGNVFGPYGGSGGYAFTAQPPANDCFLAWISGKANLRLDSVAFHWRCPLQWHQDSINQNTLEDSLDQETEDHPLETSKSSSKADFNFLVFLLIFLLQ